MTTRAQAYLFPGQGAQQAAMLDGFRACLGFPERVRIASEVLGFDLCAELARQGQLLCNRNAVSSLLVALTSSFLLDSLRAASPCPPAALAGYSVGQLIALYAAGTFSFPQLVQVIVTRARFMDEDLAEIDCGMLGVIGLAEDRLRALCSELDPTGEALVVSNLNAVGQYSLAGVAPALSRAAERLQQLGARRVVRLPVRGAWHSPLLRNAAQRFRAYLESIPLSPPSVPVADNVTGRFLPADRDALRRLLGLHICSPVRWSDCIKTLIAAGCGDFLEVGYGITLTKFGPFIDRGARHRALGNPNLAVGDL